MALLSIQRHLLLLVFYVETVQGLSMARGANKPVKAASVDHGYYWPTGHGLADQEGYSPYAGPRNLSQSFAWSWHHPQGRFHTLGYGTTIDDKRNIYLFTDTALWKINPMGKAIWTFKPHEAAAIFYSGSISDGRVHFITLDGKAWAVSMATGEELWSQKFSSTFLQPTNGFVTSSQGMVIVDGEVGRRSGRTANQKVFALNATDGKAVWTFTPDAPLWNFRASISMDGKAFYQDYEGRAYCHDLRTGELLWKAGGHLASWTDGTGLLNNGVFYSVSAFMAPQYLFDSTGSAGFGLLSAHEAATGSPLWEVNVPLPPNNVPVVGLISGFEGPTIVQPGGYQGHRGGPTGLYAFDALTGEHRWTFHGPKQKSAHQAGELQGLLERVMAGASPTYITNPWSAPTIDSQGTLYIGHEDGFFFALNDLNNDGKLEGDEISSFDTGSAFVGSSSPAHAPGMVAAANCEGLFVFTV